MLRKKPVVTLNTACPCPRNSDSHTIDHHIRTTSRHSNQAVIARINNERRLIQETADKVAQGLIIGITPDGKLIPRQLPPRQVTSLMGTLGYSREEISSMLQRLEGDES